MGDGGQLPTGTVTFLFTDIEGSTRLAHELGAEYESLLDAHRSIVRSAIAKSDGVEVACPGDGFVLAFAHASDAVDAALAAQRELTSFPWPDHAPLKVRMGVHSGPVRVTSTGGTYVGLAVHEAARVMDAAHGGQILVSGTAHSLLERALDVAFVDLGHHELRDIVGSKRLYEVRGDGLPVGFSPLRGAIAPGNLPTPQPLVGRADDVAAIVQSLRAGRLVTLIGPGGVGKTSLATAVAHGHRTPGGAWLVDLAALPRDAPEEAVVNAVGSTMSIETSGDLTALTTALRARDVLVLLDNCEHVLHAVGAVVDAVAARCPEVVLMATSREAVGVRSESLFTVDTLPMAEAETLFYARAADLAVNVEADSDGVRRICRSLDGLPLAIELAARRARALSPSAIADRLDDRFRLLATGARGALPRHATLEATVRWSYDLLDERERVLFRRLSVFVGGWTLQAAEIVCGFSPLAPGEVLDLLAALVERSMVATTDDRYAMLETLRAFAAAQLDEASETAATRDVHLRWAGDHAMNSTLALSGPTSHLHDERTQLRLAAADVENVRAAVAWATGGNGDAEAGLMAASSVGWFGQEIGTNVTEARGWIEALLPRSNDPVLRAWAMLSAANAALIRGDLAGPLIDGALELAEAHEPDGDTALMARLMQGIYWTNTATNREQAREQLAEVTAGIHARGLLRLEVIALAFESTAAILAGEPEVALVLAEEGVSLGRQCGAQIALSRNLEHVARALARLGDASGALAAATESLAVAEAVGAVAEQGIARARLSRLASQRGDWDECIGHLEIAISRFEQSGLWLGASQARASAALLAIRLDDPDAARANVREMVEAARLGGSPALAALLVSAPARAARAAGNEALALELEAAAGRSTR